MRNGSRLRRLATSDLSSQDIAALRTLLWAAFASDGDGFAEEDWDHARGGVHVIRDLDGEIVAHAAIVERDIRVGGQPLRTGYVEAVATAPGHQGRGHGTAVMEVVGKLIRDGYELGVLGTGSHHFYERLGWSTWAGPSFVRTPDGDRATPDEDGSILVLRTPLTPPLDPRAQISCEWRSGDVW